MAGESAVGSASGRRQGRVGDRRLLRASLSVRRAVAFAYYGLGGLGIAFVVVPLVRAADRLRGRGGSGDLGVQRIVHHASRSFVALAERLRLLRIRWRGTDALRHGPLLVVANHPSLIDTPLLTSCMPQADFVVSPAWCENPFLRRAISSAGYLRTDLGARLIRDAAARLRVGRSVVIYPEGSRTPPEGLRRFHRGAAHIALEAECDLVPVVIRVVPRTLMKGQRWHDAPDRTPEWTIQVGEPIRLAERLPEYLAGRESRPLAARRLTTILRQYFEQRWPNGEC